MQQKVVAKNWGSKKKQEPANQAGTATSVSEPTTTVR